jgi:hypothetical protein
MKVRTLSSEKDKNFLKARIGKTIFKAPMAIFSSSLSCKNKIAFDTISLEKTGVSGLKFRNQKRSRIGVHETENVENIKQSGYSKKLLEKRESKIRVRADFMVDKTIKSGTELWRKVKTSLKEFWKAIRNAVTAFSCSLFCVKSIVCQLSQCECESTAVSRFIVTIIKFN